MVISTKIGYNRVAGSLRCSEADYTIPVNIDRKDADDIRGWDFYYEVNGDRHWNDYDQYCTVRY